jgi:hypothetical protein
MGLDTNCNNIKTSFPCLQSLLIKHESFVCVNTTNITLQMGLDISYNNIKDVHSMPTVFPHQTWVTCMCIYHKITLQMGLDTRCKNNKEVLSLPTVTTYQTWVTCKWVTNITSETEHKL